MMQRRAVIRAMGLTWIGLHTGLLVACGEAATEAARVAPGEDGALAALRALAGALPGVEYVGPVCSKRVGVAQPLEYLHGELAPAADNLVAAISQRVADDFAAGRIEDIDGWQLSRTECLLLAAAAAEQGLERATRARLSDYAPGEVVEVRRWGPRETLVGEVFNPQGEGRAAFWVDADGPINQAMRLSVDGRALTTYARPGVITASLDAELTRRIISEPGVHEVELLDTARRVSQSLGFLKVLERPPAARLEDGSVSKVFCEIERWGPDMALAGEPFNEQPDGSSSFWVRIGCAPDEAVLELDGVALETTVRPGLVTGRVEHYARLERGEHPLTIVDPDSNERLLIGYLTIQ